MNLMNTYIILLLDQLKKNKTPKQTSTPLLFNIGTFSLSIIRCFTINLPTPSDLQNQYQILVSIMSIRQLFSE